MTALLVGEVIPRMGRLAEKEVEGLGPNWDTTKNPGSFDPSARVVLACLVEAPTR